MTAILIFTRILDTIIGFKLLTWDKKASVKEILCLIGISIFITYYLTILHYHAHLPVLIRVFILDINILTMLAIVAYRKGYSLKKSLILPLLSLSLTTISEILVFFGTGTENVNIIEALLTTLLMPVVSFCFIHLTKKVRSKVNQSKEMQNALLYGFIFIFILSHIVASFRHFLFSVHQVSIFLIIILIVLSSIFFFYAKAMESKYQLQRKQDEQEAMQYYINEIEKQYTDMRKFKHDYQNILVSINGYIEDSDLDGLRQYFHGRVKIVSEKIIKQDFMLENLSRIKIREIKSIFAAKLIMAHEKGVEISFEAREDIDTIPMNTITLVRMLGIVLDNAIEALIELGEGILQVGVWKEAEEVTFVVQNLCRLDLPKLHELERVGFSTKGEKRGLGLNNLSELAEEEANVVLQTAISNNQFIQKIIITGDRYVKDIYL